MSFACPVYDSSAALADPSSGVYAMAMKNMVVQRLEAPDDSSTREEVAILNNETNVAKIFSGEVVPSLRPLLHRDYLIGSLLQPTLPLNLWLDLLFRVFLYPI